MSRKFIWLGAALIAMLLMIPAGSAEAQCGCGAICGDAIEMLFSCLLSDDPTACIGSPEDFLGMLMACSECMETCADTSCYDNCYLNIEVGLDCEPGDLECAMAGVAGLNSCMRACDSCGETRGCDFGDARLDQYSCAQPVATYCTAGGIEVWDIDAGGVGTLLLTAPAAGDIPASNQTLAQSGDVILSRLSTGEFQVNALDGEGNPYVLVWDGCPASEVYLVR